MLSQENSEKCKVYVQMFEQFIMSRDDKLVSKDTLRSDTLLKLAAYILYNHDKTLTHQMLSEVMWPEDGSDNPMGALKNLMYRLRSNLKKTFGDEEFIISGRGYYQWNSEIPVVADYEEFSEAAKRTLEAVDDPEIIEYGHKVVALYKGDFLPELHNEYEVLSLSAHYHSLYLTTVKTLIRALIREGSYSDAESTCRAALLVDSLDEDLHILLIRTLIADNKQQLATAHYHETVKLLNENLGIKPSEELQGIYTELLNKQHGEETDIFALHSRLINRSWKQGPLFCEYGMFKKVYTFMSYNSKRLGITGQLSLVTVAPDTPWDKESQAYQNLVQESMVYLRDILEANLRTNDMACRLSPNQYLLMLTACQYEDGVVVMDRISEQVNHLTLKHKFSIDYLMHEIIVDQH